MGMYAVQTADTGELAELREAASDGRAVAMSRRRALAAGRSALPPGQERARTGSREAELRAPATAVNATPSAASNGEGASNGAPTAPEATAAPTNGVAAAQLGRALSIERRRQLSQGKQALNGAGAPPVPETTPPAHNGHSAPAAPQATAAATNGVAAAYLGRALSIERRRRLSQGKQALNGAGAPPVPEKMHVDAAGATPPAPEATATNGVAAAQLGRALSVQRRRRLSQGKQALIGGVAPTAPAAPAAAPPAAESRPVDAAASGREQARARRVEASRFGSAGVSRPQREGRVTHPPKVIVSPTQARQGVTGLRIGPGVRVTGDEAGAALPVSGTQYVAADGSAPAMGAGPKVGLVRTPQGLVVSGTTVRNKVHITGDEAGEHLLITGEADQKFGDDLTPRRDGTYRPAQFPRRADPHGATAVGTRLVPQPRIGAPTGDGPWHPLENTDGGLAVTGTAVGRSGRVTGNEAGACRPITGDQYQHLPPYSSECAGTGGGTAPAAHLNRARLDPVTAGKVTEAQTWGGQRVTGPSVEHRPNVTGDEPGSCRPVTGTPYQGPSTAFGWCESDDGRSAARRLDARPKGVAVTGDLPMPARAVTGTERGQGRAVTGTAYYGDLRAAEPAAEDWTRSQAFPVALARRLAGGESDDATQETENAAPPPSTVPGCITGSFAVGDGMVTGNNEFLFQPRQKRDGTQPAVTGEGQTGGRTITGSPAAWTSHDRVTGTEGYIAAGRNPSEGGSAPHAWAGARKFRDLATPGAPRQTQNVTGLSGWSSKAAARITLSGGAQG